jgi:hypothetical protein
MSSEHPPVDESSYKPLEMMILDMTLKFLQISATSRYVHDPGNLQPILDHLNTAIVGLEQVRSSYDCPRLSNHGISCGCIPIQVDEALQRWRIRENEEEGWTRSTPS